MKTRYTLGFSLPADVACGLRVAKQIEEVSAQARRDSGGWETGFAYLRPRLIAPARMGPRTRNVSHVDRNRPWFSGSE